jgi:hypothetical protein
MRMPIASSVLGIALCFAAGCDSSMDPPGQPQVEAQLNVPFTLAPGQTAVFAAEDFTLTFNRVVDDGRCPVDVVCTAAGSATMAVLAKQGATAPLSLRLLLPENPGGVPFGAFRVHAVGLTPEKRTDRTIRLEDYRVELLVDRP